MPVGCCVRIRLTSRAARNFLRPRYDRDVACKTFGEISMELAGTSRSLLGEKYSPIASEPAEMILGYRNLKKKHPINHEKRKYELETKNGNTYRGVSARIISSHGSMNPWSELCLLSASLHGRGVQ